MEFLRRSTREKAQRAGEQLSERPSASHDQSVVVIAALPDTTREREEVDVVRDHDPTLAHRSTEHDLVVGTKEAEVADVEYVVPPLAQRDSEVP